MHLTGCARLTVVDSQSTEPRTLFIRPDDPERAAKISPSIDRLAWVLDDAIEIPVIGRRIGIDGLIGLVPGAGPAAGLAASLPVIMAGIAAGVAVPTLARMVLNVAVDAIVGSVPFLGNVFDFVFKANARNVGLIYDDLNERDATRRKSIEVLVLSALVIVVLVGVVLVISAAVTFLVLRLLTEVF